jgi:hypothetical protein
MGHHVLVVDDARRRRVTAALFHPRASAAAARNAQRDLILAEVSQPQQHGMDQDLVERTL